MHVQPLGSRNLLPAALSVVLTLLLVRPADGQAARADSLEAWIRRGYVLGTPGSRETLRELGWSGVGFGFRTLAARGGSNAGFEQSIEQFGASMEYFRVHLHELQTRVEGDIGLAWGIHTEVFQVIGQAPESVRVRFTNTLRWDGRSWKNLLYHRDAQPFSATGRYIKAPR